MYEKIDFIPFLCLSEQTLYSKIVLKYFYKTLVFSGFHFGLYYRVPESFEWTKLICPSVTMSIVHSTNKEYAKNSVQMKYNLI